MLRWSYFFFNPEHIPPDVKKHLWLLWKVSSSCLPSCWLKFCLYLRQLLQHGSAGRGAAALRRAAGQGLFGWGASGRSASRETWIYKSKTVNTKYFDSKSKYFEDRDGECAHSTGYCQITFFPSLKGSVTGCAVPGVWGCVTAVTVRSWDLHFCSSCSPFSCLWPEALEVMETEHCPLPRLWSSCQNVLGLFWRASLDLKQQ